MRSLPSSRHSRPAAQLVEPIEQRFLFAATLGTNLIVNPGAESGSGAADAATVIAALPGWTKTSQLTAVKYGAPAFPTPTGPGPSSRGKNFFAGGPGAALSTAKQTIDVAALASGIDAKNVGYNLSGFLGGYSSQTDNAVLTATFRNASGTALGSAKIGPVTAANRGSTTGLLSRSTTGLVPVGTRKVAIELKLTRDSGSYNDGYADNLSLVLSTPKPPGDPDDTITEAKALPALTIGGTKTDKIASGTDVDVFRFTVSAGQKIGFDIDRPSGSTLDSFVRVFNASGTVLASNDDGKGPGETTLTTASYVEYKFATAGTYFVGVSGDANRSYSPTTGNGDVGGSTGAYTLQLTLRPATTSAAAASPFASAFDADDEDEEI